MTNLPRAILFDLDDTIIKAYAKPAEAWDRLLKRFAEPLGIIGDEEALVAIRQAMMATGREFWTNREIAARWRLDIPKARRTVARLTLDRLGRSNDALAERIADDFTEMRRLEYELYPDAHHTLDTLKSLGVRLALITNGQAEIQRAKVARFALEGRFDHIQIEGEFGRGKPEPDVYHHALERLGVGAAQTWMVGDNLEWEVETPQKLGMVGIWYDPFGDGLPADTHVVPDRILRRLAELID